MDLPFGTQKRVELARALASQPKLLLLDEPAGGLNHEEVGVLMDLLRDGSRPAQADDAAGRAPHEHGDARVRQGGGARLRPHDRRRHAGRGAGQSGRDPRLPGDRRADGAPARACAACTPSTAPTRVLHGIDFAVEEGGITTILGANGAGKTTTLRAVCGMVKTQGEVTLDGDRIEGKATESIVRAGVAHVPDGRGTFVNLTVEENLRLGAYTRQRQGRGGRRLRAHVRLLPAPEGAPAPAGRHAVGRRAADARGLARADAAAAPAAARRALVRPGAADRARAVRDSSHHQPARSRQHAAGRAERVAGAEAGRPRLPARDRPGRDLGHRARRSATTKRSAAPTSATSIRHEHPAAPDSLGPCHRRHLCQRRAGAGDDLPGHPPGQFRAG